MSKEEIILSIAVWGGFYTPPPPEQLAAYNAKEKKAHGGTAWIDRLFNEHRISRERRNHHIVRLRTLRRLRASQERRRQQGK
jgi:hypothetical protein